MMSIKFKKQENIIKFFVEDQNRKKVVDVADNDDNIRLKQ